MTRQEYPRYFLKSNECMKYSSNKQPLIIMRYNGQVIHPPGLKFYEKDCARLIEIGAWSEITEEEAALI